jgi:fructose-1,6-bisphosphatase
MDSKKNFKVRCDHSSVIDTLLECVREIAVTLQHTPVMVLETVNKFGDQQLHLDVHCDELVEKHLRENSMIRGLAS